MIVYLLVVTITLCFLYYYSIRTFNYWSSKNVRGPKPIPFFGNFKDVALRKKHTGMLYHDIYKQYPEEKVVGFYRMTLPTLLIRDLDIVKQVLIKDFDSLPDRGSYFSKKGLGENLFHSDFNTWKLLRQRFTPIFTTTKFKGIFTQLANHGDKFLEYIEDVTRRQPEQDIYQIILKYTVGTTMIAVFGIDIDIFNDDNKLFEIIDRKFQPKFYNEIDLILPGILTKFNLSIIDADTIKFSHQLVESCLNQQRFAKHRLHNVMDVIRLLKREGNTKTIEHLMNNENSLSITNDLLAAQAWIFYLAGYGNITLSLTYAMYYLAHNSNVQNKLQEEIIDIVERNYGKLTYETLTKMKYLNMVFHETLRMYPLTGGLVRNVSQDTKLEGVNLTLAKGAVVIVSPYSIQRDERYYPEPDKFNPDRFLPENTKDRHPCAFLSFGIGRRSCIGSQLARIQFGICLVKLLLKFRLETSKNTVSSINFDPCRLLLAPKSKIYLNFVPKQVT